MHTIQTNHLIVCEDCDAIVDIPYCVYESNLKEEHNSINGYCECGYVQIVDDLFDGSVAYLPDSLKEIGEEALLGIAARTVVIPYGATTIQAGAFEVCENLKYVVIPANVRSIAGDAFDGCNNDLVIVTTPGSVAESYAEANRISCVTR